MSDKIFSEPFVNLGGKQKYTVLVSIVAHTFIIAAAIIVPVVATDSLVLPRSAIRAFITQPPLPPSPPPPRGDTKAPPPVTTSIVPLVAPPAIIQEIPIQLTSGPLPGFDSAGLVPGTDYFAAPAAPAAAPVPDQVPLRPGGDVKRPLKIRDATPAYPPLARAAHVEGVVIIEATIGPDGKVQDARILRSANPLLNAAALDAVRQWEYTPTLLNGIPMAIVMTVTVDFRLR